MGSERQTKAVGYVHVATLDEWGTGAQIQRHKDTIFEYCSRSRIRLSHMMIDIGRREGRGWALDRLVAGKAAVLVVPSLSQLTRKTGELAKMLDHYFSPPSGVADLIAVGEGIDTRTPQGRMAIDLVCCVARFEAGSVYHA
jgi:DNA invertase Pin-like site-specific DNA recombinase